MGRRSLLPYPLRIQQAGHNLPAMRASPRRILSRLSLVAGLLFLGLPGAAEAAFRCGSRLVSEGDTTGAVRAICGPPTQVQHTTIWRAPIIWRGGRPLRVPGGDIEVQVEIWTYNLGPSQLMRRIRFEDDQITEMDTLGYGY
jgi:hypothetical protein